MSENSEMTIQSVCGGYIVRIMRSPTIWTSYVFENLEDVLRWVEITFEEERGDK